MKKSILSFILFMIFINMNSQTYTAGTAYSQYHDINPDQQMHYVYFPLTHQIYDLNVFGDTTKEIEFVADGSSSPGGSSAYINIKSLDPHVFILMGRLDSVYDSTSTSWLVTNVAKPLHMGEVINSPSANWVSGMLYLTDNSASFGWSKHVNDFVASGDIYIGLKYQSGSTTTYGWLRVAFPAADSAFVKDFAFPGAVGIEENAIEKMKVYPNPVTHVINIENGNRDIQRIELMNLTGDLLDLKYDTYSSIIQLNLNDDIPPGCYFLKCYSEKNIMVKQIIKVE